LNNFSESETLEAVAQFDFTARSQRELSFKKGDVLTLYTQVSGDWWKGSKDGRDGLVPDKYIMLRIRLFNKLIYFLIKILGFLFLK
jgi:SLIT-ROBO Rho GTPase activating protein